MRRSLIVFTAFALPCPRCLPRRVTTNSPGFVTAPLLHPSGFHIMRKFNGLATLLNSTSARHPAASAPSRRICPRRPVRSSSTSSSASQESTPSCKFDHCSTTSPRRRKSSSTPRRQPPLAARLSSISFHLRNPPTQGNAHDPRRWLSSPPHSQIKLESARPQIDRRVPPPINRSSTDSSSRPMASWKSATRASAPTTSLTPRTKLRKKSEYDPSKVSDDAHQSGLVSLHRHRLQTHSALARRGDASRVERIGNSLIPAYQRVLPDDDPAKDQIPFPGH